MTIIITFPVGSSNKPIIGYQNFFELGTVTASVTSVDYPFQYAYDWKPHTYWKAVAGSSWIKVQLPLARLCNYIAIYGHTLADAGATVSIQYSDDGSTWTTTATVIPTSSAPIMVTFTDRTAMYWRILVVAASDSLIAAVSCGKYMQLERGILAGFTPPVLSRNTELTTTESDDGTFLGRSIARQGSSCSLSMDYVTPGWMRTHWLPFMRHAELKPFFLKWDVVTYQDDVIFGWVKGGGIPSPSYMHPSFMKCDLSIKGKTE